MPSKYYFCLNNKCLNLIFVYARLMFSDTLLTNGVGRYAIIMHYYVYYTSLSQ